jgi:RND family efflux transporter MFP subunit
MQSTKRVRNLWLGAAGLAVIGLVLYWRLGPTAVQVVQPVRATAVEAIYATGSVEPAVMLPISSRVAGTLAELAVDEGSAVRKGQVLARLGDTDLRSTVDEQAARARFATENFQRTQDLLRRGFISQGELDRARADREAADAALARARTQRDFTALVAPADGVIIRRDGEIGQYFPAGQALFTLSCCAPLRVAVEVDEEDILRVRVGQKALMRLDALSGRTIEGTVAQITPKGDPVSRSYRVRIRLDDPAAVKVGMTVDANLIVAEHDGALLVPTAAVQAGKVWIVRDGRLVHQSVKAGIVGADRTEVLEGIDESAHVVPAPVEGLVDNQRARETLVAAASAGAARSGQSTGAAPGGKANVP